MFAGRFIINLIVGVALGIIAGIGSGLGIHKFHMWIRNRRSPEMTEKDVIEMTDEYIKQVQNSFLESVNPKYKPWNN